MEDEMTEVSRRLVLGAIVIVAALTASCERIPSGPGGDHSLGRVEITDRGQAERPVVATWTTADGWTGSLPAISLASVNQRVSLGARVYDGSGQERALSQGEYSVRWALAPNAPVGVVVNDDSRGDRFHGDHIHIYGQAPGTTRIQLVLWHADHADGATPPIEIQVVN